MQRFHARNLWDMNECKPPPLSSKCYFNSFQKMASGPLILHNPIPPPFQNHVFEPNTKHQNGIYAVQIKRPKNISRLHFVILFLGRGLWCYSVIWDWWCRKLWRGFTDLYGSPFYKLHNIVHTTLFVPSFFFPFSLLPFKIISIMFAFN